MIALGAAVFAALGASTASAVTQPTDPVRLTLINTVYGTAVADQNGNALYAWSMDSPGASGCTDGCESVWPAATGTPTKDAAITAPISAITDPTDPTRQQVTLADEPLYYFVSDNTPGDINGHAVSGFTLLGPDGSQLLG